jgi:thioredoxin reductase
MVAEQVDVVVIGAGPAGLSAATRVAATGLSVVLLDEQDAVGGQIYRAIERTDARRREILGPDYAAGATIAVAFARSGARHVANASVWQVTRERSVHYLKDGKVGSFEAKRVVLATGAMERPFPIPGWTLPGVLTAGAAQILLKSAGEVPAEPPVLVGCGPLLYLLGWQYVRAGVPIRALVDTTRHEDRWRAKRHLLSALRAWPFLSKGLQLMRTLREAGVPMHEAADDLRIEATRSADGVERVAALHFTTQGKAHRIDANLILLHQGVVPNTQFTLALRAKHRWDAAQLCFAPVTDAWGELDVPGIFVAGDGSGIGGAQAAAEQGELSALAVAAQLGASPEARRCHAHPSVPRQPLSSARREPHSRRRRDRVPLRGSHGRRRARLRRARLPRTESGEVVRPLRHGTVPGTHVRADGHRSDRERAQRGTRNRRLLPHQAADQAAHARRTRR